MAKWQVSVRCENSVRNVQVEAETESTACSIAMDRFATFLLKEIKISKLVLVL